MTVWKQYYAALEYINNNFLNEMVIRVDGSADNRKIEGFMKRYGSVADAIKGCFGHDVRIENSSGIISSDINSAKTLRLSNGHTVFLKMNSMANYSFFEAEAEGIEAIARTGAVKTPKLYAMGRDPELGVSFLMMELIEGGRPGRDTWTRFGRSYAEMHLADTSEFVEGGRYGFLHDNYIGATRQINRPKDSWIDFFRECRLEPQFKMAQKYLDVQTIKDSISLMERLDSFLGEPEHPSLLHGDMWGGNHLIDGEGMGVLIDPAVYVGHSEADIAMTYMFNPMPRDFYEGYYERIPKEEGFEDRREIYNLYHWLNHLNLFGESYLMPVVRIVGRFA